MADVKLGYECCPNSSNVVRSLLRCAVCMRENQVSVNGTENTITVLLTANFTRRTLVAPGRRHVSRISRFPGPGRLTSLLPNATARGGAGDVIQEVGHR